VFRVVEPNPRMVKKVDEFALRRLEVGRPMSLRCDNGPQYTSHVFKDSMDALDLRPEYILYHTPEQSEFVESFHKTLKREYVWSRDFQNHQKAGWRSFDFPDASARLLY
jgi:transposase InsO family protein